MLKQDAQDDLQTAREGLAKVEAEKRRLDEMRQEKTRLEVENQRLAQLKNEIVVPDREAVLHGLRYQAKAKIDQDEKAKGKKPPFEEIDLKKLSLGDRIRKMREQGRPAGFIAWLTSAGKHYDQEFAKTERQLGLALVNESKLNQWFSEKHEPRVAAQASATVSSASSRKQEVAGAITSNEQKIQQLSSQIPQAAIQVAQAEIKATATMRLAESKVQVVETKGQELLRDAEKASHQAGGGDVGAMFEAAALRAEAAAEQQVADLEKQAGKRQAAASRAAAMATGPK